MIIFSYEAILVLLELDYRIVDYACKYDNQSCIGKQYKLFFSFSKLITVLSEICKPTNLTIASVLSIAKINLLPFELKSSIIFFLFNHSLLDTSNESSMVNIIIIDNIVLDRVIQLPYAIYRRNIH